MVGRLEYLKNQLCVIQWAKQMDWPLTVVGDKNVNQEDYYKQCTAEAGRRTKFLPFQSTTEIIKLMDQHKVFIVPSLFESYSLVAWEAAARGMAVVANEVADMSETLAPVAELTDFNVPHLAQSVIEFELTQRQPRTKKSQAWFENYTWDEIGQKIDEAYR